MQNRTAEEIIKASESFLKNKRPDIIYLSIKYEDWEVVLQEYKRLKTENERNSQRAG